MKGTEKQVKWAEEIKNGVFATLDRADAQRNDRLYTIDTDVHYLSPEAVIVLREEYEAGFAKIDSAAWIIDHRGAFAPAQVIKHGRDWMWNHGQTASDGLLVR